jgi:DNA polymerase III alpha subunit
MGQVSIEDFLFEDDETETEAEPSKSIKSKELQLNIADLKILVAEKKSLSDYISGHPLTIAHKFTNNFFPNTSDVRRSRLDENVRVLGVIADVDIKTTAKKQQKMAVFELEDNKGRVRCVIFPPRSPKKSDISARQEDQYDGFEKYREFLDSEDIYLVEGKWSNSNDDERNIVVSAIHPFMNAIENNIPFIKIYLRHDAAKDEIEALHTLLRNHSGELPVILEIEKESHIISLNLNSAKIRPNYGFFEALDDAHINYDLASRKRTGVFQESQARVDEEHEAFEDTDDGYDEFEGEDDGNEE